MELDISMIFLGLLSSFLLIICARIVYTVWWKPKALERYFRGIGINGTSYRFMSGDLEDIKRLMSEASAKPMSLSHNIVPRVRPDYHQMVHKYGKLSMYWHQHKPTLLVADAKMMKDILIDKNGMFQKQKWNNPLVDLLTLGLTTLDGIQWEKRKKVIGPAFHHDKLMEMIPIFINCCHNLVERWKEQIGGYNEKFELDIANEIQNLTSDIIAKAAFGTNFEEVQEIFELQKEQMCLVMEAFHSLYIPGLRFLPTKKNQRRYEIDRTIKKILEKMIVEKEKKIQKGDGDDLLSLLLKCQKQANDDMSLDDVMEECKLFYFAGQDTTANWLTWTMIVLSMHPNWQDKAREEVLHVFGKKTPDVKSLSQLKIVSMILYEVIRLYPPVTSHLRTTLKSAQIGEKVIPPGIDIILPVIVLHHDPDHWGDDVDEFKPERFAEGVSKASKDQEIAFYPFGWGPRICLGQSFATLEVKLALTMILQHFSFELSPSYSHAPHIAMMVQPQYGAPLILHKI